MLVCKVIKKEMIFIEKYTRKAQVDNFELEELQKIVKQSFSWRELSRNLGYKSFGAQSKKALEQRLINNDISTEHFTSSHVNKMKRSPDNVFIKNTTACPATVRKYFKDGNYIEYKCSICGLEPYWNGKELVLTMDHINGDNSDNELANLRWVCPNCDRQLETYGGRNHRNKKSD